MNTITDKILAMYPSFTTKQKIIGKYISENIFDTALMNAPQIAQKAKVSEATLTRFVYALGYKNFSEFQLDLRKQAQSGAADNPFNQERLSEGELPICHRVFNLEKALIEETQRMLDLDVFDKCVNKLVSANNVMVVGGPCSDYVARYFVNYLTILRPNVCCENRLDLSFYGNIQAMGPKSVALVISYPRYPKMTMRIAQALADKKVPIIGITDSPLSPLAKLSDYTFYTPQKYFVCVSPNAPTFSLLHSFLIAMYQKNPKISKKRFDAYEQDILSTDVFEYKDYNFSELL
ncbi:MAG: MurR/RpiR family transcriptional regulator [bacterium]|nr:MurR/RpiR family transcriptional regulator [bacterium]